MKDIRLKKSVFAVVFILLLLCIALLCWMLNSPATSIEEDPIGTEDQIIYDYPPFIYINDSLFQYGGILDETITLTDYLGSVSSSVPSNELPEQNFQSNEPIVGAEIYKYGGDIIVILDGQYRIYHQIALQEDQEK